MKILKEDILKTIVSVAMGIFFALCTMLARFDFFIELCGNAFLLLCVFVGLSLAIAAFMFAACTALKGLSLVISAEDRRDTGRRRLLLVFFASFFLLLGWFCMWMLFRFPVCLSPDSTWQLMQARGLEPLSNHHPIVHTMIIRLCINLGFVISDNPSVALAMYAVIQAAVLSSSYAYLITTLYKMRIKRWVIVLVFLSLILLPYHGALSVTMVKDVWFAAFILILCLSVWRLMVSLKNGGKACKWDIALLFVSSLGMCLFRTNGLYAFIFFLPFVVFYFFKKSRAAALLPVAAALIALLVTGPLYSALGIVPPDTIESLAIPIQHVTRAVVDGAELDDSQLELLNGVVDVEAAAGQYSPHLADPVKLFIRHEGDPDFLIGHKGELFRLWLELGLENPLSYLNAHIDLIRGYIYPLTDGVVMYPYFTETTSEGYCMLPGPIASVLSAMAIYMPRIPVFNLFFSNGAAIWLYIALFGICIVKRRYAQLLLFVPVLAVWLTLLVATPLDNEFRYAYSVFATLPLMCVLPFTSHAKLKD